jgi:hypothetical protein
LQQIAGNGEVLAVSVIYRRRRPRHRIQGEHTRL